MIILDTDTITFLEHRESAMSLRLRNRLTELSAEHEVVTTAITYEEQTRGWMKKFARARDAREVVEAYGDLLEHLKTYQEIVVIPHTLEAEEKFRELRKDRIRISSSDLRIAAAVLTRHAILMTRNVRDFRQVPRLAIEDWAKP